MNDPKIENFNQSIKLTTPLQQHNNRKKRTPRLTYPCIKCNYKSIRLDHLNNHLKIHEKEDEKQYAEVGFTCLSGQKLELKIINETQVDNKNQWLNTFTKHHVDSQLFKCTECNYGCKRLYQLKRHSAHHSLKNLCSYCGKYSSSDCIKMHKQDHTEATFNEKLNKRIKKQSYSCVDCEYSCSQSTRLRMHIKSHINPQYMCLICECWFGSVDYLNSHRKVHKKLQIFSCDQCNYKSWSKFNFKRHMMAHAKARQFLCPKCTFNCSQSNNLKRHIAHVHKKDIF